MTIRKPIRLVICPNCGRPNHPGATTCAGCDVPLKPAARRESDGAQGE